LSNKTPLIGKKYQLIDFLSVTTVALSQTCSEQVIMSTNPSVDMQN
jgi:hypothetical protein